jgi:ligand-binding sensor domain-containing protein
VLQDSYGFIWIGDQGGLVKYDGYKLKRYTQIPFDSNSLSNNWVIEIKEDIKGNLWVGTWNGGLNYFDQKTQKFYHFVHEKNNPNSISSNTILSILVNDDGSLWLGTLNQGLIYMKIDSNGNTSYRNYNLNIDPNPPVRSGDNFVLDLYKDRHGKIWIGTIRGGLKLLDPTTGELTHYKNDPDNPTSISSNIVSSICEDDFGNLWIGTGHFLITEGNGLNKFDLNTKQFIHYKQDPQDPYSICSNNISSLLIDSEGILWIGSIGNQLNSIPISELLSSRKPRFTHYSDFDRNTVNSIDEDRLGNIWISFHGRTVYKFNKQQNPFIWYRHIENNPNSLSWRSVHMVQVDKSGNIWFGTDGLDLYDPITGTFKHFPYDPGNPLGLSSDNVTSISEDKYGFYWFGTDNSGLNRLNPKTGVFKHIFENPEDSFGLRSNNIYEVLISSSGDLWVASGHSGLQLYDIEENRFYYFDQDTNSVKDETITGIFEDQSSTLWSNTVYGCYALRIKNRQIESVKHYIHDPNNRNSLSSNHVEDIIRPRIIDTNAVWIATNIGLNRLDLNTETFTHYFVEDGLPSNFILKVLEDNEGNIWCSCANDIAVYNIKTGKISSYSGGDGMPFTGFGNRSQNACKTADGQLIFSGGSGALGFYPEQLKENLIVPPIRITDFKIFHKSFTLDTAIHFINEINLSYNQNVFSFEFAALNFTNAEKNQYAYKLEGLYDDWIYIGNERLASFTDIDPGEYIFRVKGTNNHGIWNKTGASVLLIITPPWWATWWLRTLMIITILGIGYSIYRYRINKVREMERLRVQIASDLHDDIGSTLTKIAVHSEIIQTTPEKTKVATSSKKIGTMSREIITTLSDVVWSIDSRNDTVGDLIDRMRDFLETVFPAGSIHIDFQTKGLHFDQKITQALRQNIYLIFKEAVNNAAKHSGGDEVKISMINGDGKFKMEIVDNGAGIKVDERHGGHHGIENMKMRAKRIGGELTINNLDRGTSVTLVAKNI